MTQTLTSAALLSRIDGGLIVSCQPVDDGPMDNIASIVAMALAARDGGATALRIEGADNVAAVAAACDLPIVGIIKRDLADSPIRITPYLEDVAALIGAGATIIAVDATTRPRPVEIADLLKAIHAGGRLAMADLSNIVEATIAQQMGFDVIGTTMSGYTGGPVPSQPDFELVAACRRLGATVIAEGRYNSPELAAGAITAGANAVCVGSAITRQEHITQWFDAAVRRAGAARSKPVLAIDIGGTKSLLTLVQGDQVVESRTFATAGNVGSPEWMTQLAGSVADWSGRFDHIGVAVTGLVTDGLWTALNAATLPIPPRTPLDARLREAFGTDRVISANDAQAAAWGEYCFGAGRNRDMMFVTVSSGVGGGIVRAGALQRGSRGLAGSLGQTTGLDGQRLESRASGFGMAQSARSLGKPDETRAIFAALENGDEWARDLVKAAATELAHALVNAQRLIDLDVIVVGGGIGLLPLYQALLREALDTVDDIVRPEIRIAELGSLAGVIGIADLALRT